MKVKHGVRLAQIILKLSVIANPEVNVVNLSDAWFCSLTLNISCIWIFVLLNFDVEPLECLTLLQRSFKIHAYIFINEMNSIKVIDA